MDPVTGFAFTTFLFGFCTGAALTLLGLIFIGGVIDDRKG